MVEAAADTLRIVLVEDDEGTRDAIRSLLSTALFGRIEVRFADNVASGVSVVQNHDTDLLIVDSRLPQQYSAEPEWENGLAVVAQLRERILRDGIKTLLYSATPDVLRKAGKLGANNRAYVDRCVLKGAAEDLIEPVITLLRERVRHLLNSPRDLADSCGTGALQLIDRRVELGSLLAPFRQEPDGSVPDFPPEALHSICAGMLAVDWRARVVSHFFNSRAFVWPSDTAFGLAPLNNFGRKVKTSGLAILSHKPGCEPHEEAEIYQAAAASVLQDLPKVAFSEDDEQPIREFAKSAMNWVSYDSDKRGAGSNLTRRFRLTLGKLCDEFERADNSDVEVAIRPVRIHYEPLTAAPSEVTWERLKTSIQIYCEPRLLNGVHEFIEATVGYADSSKVEWGCVLRYAGSVPTAQDHDSDLGNLVMPYLECVIGHRGRWMSDEDFEGAFRKGGHPSAFASVLLKGYGSWAMKSRSGESRVVLPGSAATLIHEVSSAYFKDYDWNVAHLLRIGLPLARINPIPVLA